MTVTVRCEHGVSERTALVHELTLPTNNRRRFELIELPIIEST